MQIRPPNVGKLWQMDHTVQVDLHIDLLLLIYLYNQSRCSRPLPPRRRRSGTPISRGAPRWWSPPSPPRPGSASPGCWSTASRRRRWNLPGDTDSISHHKTSLNISKHQQTLQNITKLYRTTPNFTEHHQTLQNTTKLYRASTHFTEQHQTLQNNTNIYRASTNFTEQHQTLQDNPRLYRTTPNITEHNHFQFTHHSLRA